MTARNGHARFGAHAGAARKNLLYLVLGHVVHGKARDGQCHDGLTAHRIDIGQRIGGGDPAEIERIIDNRHEEVGRSDHTLLVVHFVNCGVVPGFIADKKRRIGGAGGQLRQHFLKHRRCYLAASASPVGKLGQPFDLRVHNGILL